MNFPCFIVSTIDCGVCEDIKYSVMIHFDATQKQEAIIDSMNLIPFMGRTVELLNAHRIELNKQKESKEDSNEERV